MNYKTKHLHLLCFFVCLFTCFFSSKYTLASDHNLATDSPQSNLQTLATSTSASVLGVSTEAPALILAIKDAKNQLATVTLKYSLNPVYKNTKNKKTGKTTKTISSYTLTSKDIALAILNPETKQVKIVVGKQNGKSMVFPKSEVDVTLIKFNGVNSKFSVNSPQNGQVLALKYLITNPESGSKAKIEAGISEALYVPYSSDFNSPEILAYGANYLNKIIKNVTDDLQNIPSQAVPGLTITQAIRPSMIKALVYAEHTDTTQVLIKNNTQGTVDQLNILLALNEGDTYKYSVSTAGARGIAQFIPSTYASLVSRHADAGLIADFVAGMSDHENAIKAMYLLLDDYAGAVRVKASQGFASGRVFDYAAASYNGGTTRVARAINAFGDTWNEDRNGQITSLKNQASSLTSQIKSLKKKITKADKKTKASLQADLNKAQNNLSNVNSQLDTLSIATLRPETINYVQKIYKVIQFFNTEEIAMQ
jgi:hypothetical protein